MLAPLKLAPFMSLKLTINFQINLFEKIFLFNLKNLN